MAWLADFPSADAAQQRAELALRWPVGAVSPLWAMFGAAASAGVAYWWMTRWTEAANIEALAGVFAPPVALTPAPAAIVAALEPVAALGPVAESVPPVVAAPEPEPAPEPEAPVVVEPPAEPDDLTRMTGIGPKLSVALAERGVTRFAQIAAWTADDLAEADAALALRGRAVREAWVAQAKRLAAGA